MEKADKTTQQAQMTDGSQVAHFGILAPLHMPLSLLNLHFPVCKLWLIMIFVMKSKKFIYTWYLVQCVAFSKHYI